jgi:hypothetical protein
MVGRLRAQELIGELSERLTMYGVQGDANALTKNIVIGGMTGRTQFMDTVQSYMNTILQFGEMEQRAKGRPGGVVYEPVTTGFAVTPRLVGQGEIEIAVAPWSDHFDQGVISTQSASTRVRTPLGAWVEIGGLSQSRVSSGYGPGYASRQESGHIFLKVDDQDAGQP